MTIRELRNNLVFWLSFAAYLYLFAFEFKYGFLITGLGALLLALTSVMLIAIVADRFTD